MAQDETKRTLDALSGIIGLVANHKGWRDRFSRAGLWDVWEEVTGHSLIKKKMVEEKALLAGEMSGHIFFADRYFGYDDGIYASLRLAGIMAACAKPLSTFLSDVPKTFSTPEIRVECQDREKFKIVEEARNWFSARFKTIETDGVRVVFDDGWGLIRASNTQPVLVLRFEASTKARLDEIQKLIEGRLKEIVSGRK